jgi:MbtH protein
MVPMSAEVPETIFEVVRNDEDQYSIWPTENELPAGWYAVGKRGIKGDCLKFIAEVWTDMRPRSARVDEEPPETSRQQREGY